MAEHHHITIISVPSLGHLIPLLEFAKRLVALQHSFQVTFLQFPNDKAFNLLRSTTTIPSSIRFTSLPPIDVSSFGTTDKFTHFILSITESLPTIENFLASQSQQTNSKQVLLVDFFATKALYVARKLSIPNYIFFTSPARFLSFMLYFPVLDQEVEGEFADLPEPIQIPGCTPFHPHDLVGTSRRRSNIYSALLYHAKNLSKVDGIILNSSQEFEPDTINAFQHDSLFKQLRTPHVFPVGPIIKNDKPEQKHECITWLDKQPVDSVVFISFGSQVSLPREEIIELAYGLELSGQRFIWVLKRVLGDTDPLVHLPEEFLERTRGRGMVIASWVPQVDILGHVATGGFLSHCGWNSTMESTVHGVPMMIWPVIAEQKITARLVDTELGVAVRVRAMRREEVERVVRLVMEGQEGMRLRGRVMELKERVLRGLEEGGCSYNSLHKLSKNGWLKGTKSV